MAAPAAIDAHSPALYGCDSLKKTPRKLLTGPDAFIQCPIPFAVEFVFSKHKGKPMDSKQARIQLIRERHRKLILEPRRRMQYALLEDWDDEPLFDDEELAKKFARTESQDPDA